MSREFFVLKPNGEIEKSIKIENAHYDRLMELKIIDPGRFEVPHTEGWSITHAEEKRVIDLINNFSIFSVNQNLHNGKTSGKVVGWWSGGVASAVACWHALSRFDDVELVFCNTHWENHETDRFMTDFEKRLGVNIKIISSEKFFNPPEVWDHYKGLNFAHGAPCSSELKREVRLGYQDIDNQFAQVFGFDYSKKEVNRAINMRKNYPEINPIFPLLEEKYDRRKIFGTLKYLGIDPPKTYGYFQNNNCIGDFDSADGGCVQGGVGYWQKMKQVFPKKYDRMAEREHEYTDAKGKPVHICRDQRRATKGNPLFLKKHPDYPDVEDIWVIKGRPPEIVQECLGMCSTKEQG